MGCSIPPLAQWLRRPLVAVWMSGLVAAWLGSGGMAKAEGPPEVVVHNGPCNASTALPVGGGMVVVADDEASPPVILRL